ncbi:MAG: hypothetical protein IKY84_00270 [Bacteroidaceae bacterium]|nr:hypothetical protein [Bacteroidaceae bacterium]
MDNKTLYEGLILATFYLRYREKKGMNKIFSDDSNFNSKKVKSIFNKSVKSVLKLDITLGIIGKEQSNEKVYNIILATLQAKGKISDEEFLSLLKNDLGITINDYLINQLTVIVKEDGVITREEKELLLKLFEEQLADIPISEKDTLKKEFKEKLKIKKTKGQRISLYTVCALTMLILMFLGAGLIINHVEKKKMEKFNIEKYVVDNPRLVFKTISFSKYIVRGTPNGTNKHLDKLNIFHLTGEADLYIEMNHLDLIEEETDYIQKRIVLAYNCPTKYPVSVDITIPSGEYNLVEEIAPEPITEKEANKIAAKTAIAGGVFGTLIGGKVAGWKAALVTGTASTVATYIATKNFVMNLSLPTNSISAQEELLMKAQELIALEVMGGNLWYEPDSQSKLMTYYENECKKQLRSVMQQFGWKEVEVKFVYK